jgi:uncharacterized protein YbjT (DUF2867 family)
MRETAFTPEDRVLILGATGFIGRRLVRSFADDGIRMRLLVRNTSIAEGAVPGNADAEIMKGDLVRQEGLEAALEGIHTAFYLVHSLGGKSLVTNTEFARKDRQAAQHFVTAADKSGLKRIIYLGGLGETGEELSEHLKSRAEVAEVLKSGRTPATILRAAVIIGAGGASFEMLRYLVERLPVMTCPKWINTRIQPIAVQDVIAYLRGCLRNGDTAGEIFDIGGPEILTYKKMMEEYAEARGLAKRLIIDLPFLTPRLSAYWVDLVTPVPSGVAHPLIEGLKNEVICKDNRIDTYVPIKKTPFRDAVKRAFSEESTGPGISGF